MMEGFIPANVVDDLLEQTYGESLVRARFSQIGRRKWARARVPFAHDVFEMQTLKGATLSPRWGLSLVYSPHVKGGRMGWHRTLKSAMLDLTFDPVDSIEPRGIDALGLSTFDEIDVFRENALARAPGALAAAAEIWAATCIPEVAAMFERLRSVKAIRFGFYNYVQHPIAYAFTLAKVGRISDARQELEKSSYANDSAIMRQLAEALERAEGRP